MLIRFLDFTECVCVSRKVFFYLFGVFVSLLLFTCVRCQIIHLPFLTVRAIYFWKVKLALDFVAFFRLSCLT